MGGGQANKGQAAQAAAQQTAASNQDMALSQSNAAFQKAMQDKLFGITSDKGGTLTGMMDPASLNTGAPTGAYKTAWNNSQNQIGRDFANERGSIAQSLANGGATSRSTPNGFQADQLNKLARGEADTRGSTYTDIVGQQHQDALNNFWNANNIASGNAASSGNIATNAAGNSGSSSAALYGTAGQYHQGVGAQLGSSAIGAAGTVGGAAAGKPPKLPGCWIAEAIYGVDDPRTLLLRLWLNTEFTKQPIGRFVMRVYVAVGQRTALAVRRSPVLRAVFTPLFERALRSARAWEATC